MLSSIRSNLYASLAHCFQGPRWEYLRPGQDNPLLRSLRELAREGSLAPLREEATELQEHLEEQSRHPAGDVLLALEAEHTRLLAGPGSAVPPAYESVYRDPHGRVMGTWATQVLRCYAEEGLSLSPRFRDCPDSLGAELEFLAYLCWEEAEAQERWAQVEVRKYRRKQLVFLQGHLCPWVPSFCGRVLSSSTSPFYHCLASVLRKIISWDRERLARVLSPRAAAAQDSQGETDTAHGAPRETQIDPGACTFCEACVTTCPQGALRLSRQASEVWLVLVPARCNGCGLCEGACPEGAIRVRDSPSLSSPPGNGERLVARSLLLRCQQCQRPLEARGLLERTLLKLAEGGERGRFAQMVRLCPECREASLALACRPRGGQREGDNRERGGPGGVEALTGWPGSRSKEGGET